MSGARSVLTPRRAIVAVILFGALMSSFYPARSYLQMRAQMRAIAAEEAELDARIEALTAEAALLSSDAEVERIARDELGMVRRGEVPFVVAAPPSSEAPAAATAGEPPASDGPSLVSRWLEAAGRAVGIARGGR